MKPQATLRFACFFAVNLAASLHAASVIQFSATSYAVAENAGQATITVQRTADLDTSVSVDFATADGTATNGLKYTAVSGTLAFGAGETNKVVAVPILNNGLIEGTKNFRVILSNPTGGAVLGTRTNVLVSITDNDVGLQFQFATAAVSEDAGAVLIGVVRGDDGTNSITVDYATSNGAATSGVDYTGVTNTLSFAAGETVKFFTVPILNDALKETSETFLITLSNPISGGVLGSTRTTTVTIQDNDPGVGFVTAKFYIHEDEGALRVMVRRGNDLALGPFTVDYATVDGTALAGQDYAATNGTLVFVAGELSRSFEVPIVNNGILEGDENFRVVLSNPTGGASLSAVTNLTVILCDATGMRTHGFAAIHREAEGVVKLAFTGGVSQRFQPFFDLYPVEVSTNLVDWQALALLQRTNSATNELTFIDPAAVAAPKRFYRVPTNHFTAAYPKPTGPYPVGRIDRLVTDPTRRNRYGISTNGSFAVSVWYPAAPTAGQQPARWFEEVMARDTSSASYWAFYDNFGFQTTPWLDRLPYLWTYSFNDAPLAEVSGTFPVVLFSPGATVDRRQDTEKLEGLASHGYVVVAVDHYDAYAVAWPDGFYYSAPNNISGTAVGLKDRVRDLVVVLNELTNWNQTDARFVGRLGLDKVGAMGMSWGGPTIVELGQQDTRCKAVVLLDPGGTAGIVQGFTTPSLTMHAPDDSDQAVFAASKTNAVWFQISNTDHFTFFNYVVLSSYPLASNREAVRTVHAYTLSFFNKWLKGQNDYLHEGPSPDFPRVVNFRKK